MKLIPMGERGVISYVFSFLIVASVLLFLFAGMSPALQGMSMQLYTGAQPTLANARTAATTVTDPTISSYLTDSFDAQTDQIESNIDILGFFFTYGWAIIVLVVVIGIFLTARQNVEAQGSGYY